MMKLITVKMPEVYVEDIDELVRNGRYSSRSEVIRTAVRELLKEELWSQRRLHGIGYPSAIQAPAVSRKFGEGLVEMEI